MKTIEELEAERRRVMNSMRPYWQKRIEMAEIEKQIEELEK